jgi:hypothetical protein
MINIVTRIRAWFERDGKIWLFRTLIFSVTAILALSELKVYSISTNTVLLFILSSLLVFFEVFIQETENLRRVNQDGILLDWNSAIPSLINEAKQAEFILVVARSGETIYYALKDVLIDRSGKIKNINIVLTRTPEDDDDFHQYQIGWQNRWEKLLSKASIPSHISIVHTSFEPVCIILDNKIAYLSFREKSDKGRLWIKCNKTSNQGAYLINLYKSWAENPILNTASPILDSTTHL